MDMLKGLIRSVLGRCPECGCKGFTPLGHDQEVCEKCHQVFRLKF